MIFIGDYLYEYLLLILLSVKSNHNDYANISDSLLYYKFI